LLEGKRILVADDNRLNQKILIFVLQKSGAEVDVANTGSETVNLVQTKRYDAILMDVQMPEMDGIEASTYIRNELKMTLPIIGLTASTMPSEFQKCIDGGMTTCTSKPFDPKELIQLIADIIPKQQ
jgi:CheY-like chemotaxis protein